MKICIPSYGRADDQPTLEYLFNLDVPRMWIYLIVSREEDLDAYQPWSDLVADIVYAPGETPVKARNAALDMCSFGEELLLLDDDIKELIRLKPGEPKQSEPIGREKFKQLIALGFAQARKANTIAWGVYPVANPYFMHPTVTNPSIIIGTVFGLIKTAGFNFDNSFTVKEDYELSCRIIRKYGALPRFNFVAAKARHYSKGGCDRFWKSPDINKRQAEKLLSMYPDILRTHPTREHEVTMRGSKKCG